VNVHQGCPVCGTAVFRFGGFYPWTRSHLPADYRSTCPSCQSVFPSNDPGAGDFTSGDYVDDGYGYVDPDGHLFLFTATYCRDQTRTFGAGIGLLAGHVRGEGLGRATEAARRLGVLLLRYAAEEIYLAAVPQFRYGPTLGVETPWDWGQTDWGAEPDPVAALFRKGTMRYCIDTPYLSEVLSLAYDEIWPLLREDDEIPARARRQGLAVDSPAQAVALIEEMLASLLQVHLDGGASSNLPMVSEGALTLVRVLERGDAQDVLSWLYDRGPDKLRVFTTDNFFPDGTPPESTGGYNNIHTNGLYNLDHQLRQLRLAQPGAYPESEYPSLLADPRAARAVHAPYDIALLGKVAFQFGDGSGPVQKALDPHGYYAPLPAETLERAVAGTGDASVRALRDDLRARRPRELGLTVLDGVGLAVLRTAGRPEGAAGGIAYGDATGHRHQDLLDVQLFAFDHPYLSDLGYPQSWATIQDWEAHWSTHNTVWGVVPGVAPSGRFAGRGRLVRALSADGLQVLDVAAERWTQDEATGQWVRPGVTYRRLLCLLETGEGGVALVDLARVRGGSEHWRTCRGLEGRLVPENAQVHPRPGTVADPAGRRGQLDRLPHPDLAGLAWMDEVAALTAAGSEAAPTTWNGAWNGRYGDGASLGLWQLRVTPGTEVLTARATAIMGTPEESGYLYHPVLWRRRPAGDGEVTCVDLLFEPGRDTPRNQGPRQIAAARAVAAPGDPAAVGVVLTTRQGREVRLYWSPDQEESGETAFADGTRLAGALAVVRDGEAMGSGARSLQLGTRRHALAGAVQEGRIRALDRDGRAVEVEGLRGVQAGDRVVVNPNGRARSYRVEEVREAEGALRLVLDVTSVLGRGRVLSAEGPRLELEYALMTRTGYLSLARLEPEAGGVWAEVRHARNPDSDHTTLELDAALAGLRPGDWLRAVDYVVGDPVRYEPLCRS
ncbi:MAG: heparinase II/III family protein, partial [Gemmatimonadota bacterium]